MDSRVGFEIGDRHVPIIFPGEMDFAQLRVLKQRVGMNGVEAETAMQEADPEVWLTCALISLQAVKPDATEDDLLHVVMVDMMLQVKESADVVSKEIKQVNPPVVASPVQGE